MLMLGTKDFKSSTSLPPFVVPVYFHSPYNILLLRIIERPTKMYETIDIKHCQIRQKRNETYGDNERRARELIVDTPKGLRSVSKAQFSLF